MRQLYEIGRELRKRYIEDMQFLPPTYDEDTLWVRSTSYNRTIMSVESLLSGLYPDGSGTEIPAAADLQNGFPPLKAFTHPREDFLSQRFQAPYGSQAIPIFLAGSNSSYNQF